MTSKIFKMLQNQDLLMILLLTSKRCLLPQKQVIPSTETGRNELNIFNIAFYH